MPALEFRLHAAGVLAPGLTSLSSLRLLNRGQITIDPSAQVDLPTSKRLPPNERRRAPTAVRLTLACIEQVCNRETYDVSSLRAVFATDDGIGEISQQMLEAINTTRQVSPLVFPNSVHGVAAGYFSIGFQNRKSATTVSQGADSFAAGLLTAATEAVTLNEHILFVAYDVPMVSPMDEVLPIFSPTATAWVISPRSDDDCEGLADFKIIFEPETSQHITKLPAWIPKQWNANSSIQGFVVLGLLQSGQDECCRLPFGDGSLVVQNIAKVR